MDASTRRTRRRLRDIMVPTVVSAVVLIPNLIVIGLGVEDFPFTTAPMFAHYVGPDSTLYAFRFEGVRDGESEPLPIEETNLGALELQRQFVSWFYRPMTDTAPFRDLTGSTDDQEAFEARIADFFTPITEFLEDRRSLAYDSVDVYVDVVDSSGELLESDLVGRYDIATSTYRQLYGAGE